MTETTNLGLPIYSDNDVPQWTNTNDGFEALDSLVNSCSSVKLNWSTPLHQFTAGNLTYTATKDCWLVGNHGETAVGTLTINGNIITQANSGFAYFIPPLPLSKGDVVTVQAVESQLYVLEGELVSGNTYVFNEAEVQLDYSDVLARLTATNTSYTATKDCWLIGSAQNVAITVNNLRIADSSTGYYLQLTPFKLNKGDVVEVSSAGQGYSLCVIGGTITGSMGALHSNIPDYSNLIASLAYNDETYTATEECIVEMQVVSLSASLRTVVKINNNMVGFSLNDAGEYIPFDKTLHLQKGDVLTWNNAHSGANLFVCNVFGIL